MFPNGKKIKLDPPPKLSSDETKAELKEVREMMAAVENMDELRKLDISFDDMMKAALQDVGATDADMRHIDEMQRQIDRHSHKSIILIVLDQKKLQNFKMRNSPNMPW